MQTQSTSDLKSVLDSLSERWSHLNGITLRLHGPFWVEVFINFYGQPPSGDTDRKWDKLFSMGFPLLREREA